MSNLKKTLDWNDLREIMYQEFGKWYPKCHTPAFDYISKNGYAKPSRAWPKSYARPLLTQKFAKWLIVNHQDEAKRFGLI